jgi:hypothetical protein
VTQISQGQSTLFRKYRLGILVAFALAFAYIAFRYINTPSSGEFVPGTIVGSSPFYKGKRNVFVKLPYGRVVSVQVPNDVELGGKVGNSDYVGTIVCLRYNQHSLWNEEFIWQYWDVVPSIERKRGTSCSKSVS